MNGRLVRDILSVAILGFALMFGLSIGVADAGGLISCQEPQYGNCVSGCQQAYDQCDQQAGVAHFQCYTECQQECLWRADPYECLANCEWNCDIAWYEALEDCESEQEDCETECYVTWC